MLSHCSVWKFPRASHFGVHCPLHIANDIILSCLICWHFVIFIWRFLWIQSALPSTLVDVSTVPSTALTQKQCPGKNVTMTWSLGNICVTNDQGYVPLLVLIHNPVLSSFMTYQWVCNNINTTGTTSGAYSSGETRVQHRFYVKFMLLHL
jgi:hypothetical protein